MALRDNVTHCHCCACLQALPGPRGRRSQVTCAAAPALFDCSVPPTHSDIVCQLPELRQLPQYSHSIAYSEPLLARRAQKSKASTMRVGTVLTSLAAATSVTAVSFDFGGAQNVIANDDKFSVPGENPLNVGHTAPRTPSGRHILKNCSSARTPRTTS